MMSNSDPRPLDEGEKRRKRLYFQCHHRGSKEADLLLGGFARAHLAELSQAQLDRFEALLANDDADIYGWLCGRLPVPQDHDDDVMVLLKSFVADRSRF